jgi:hypothetical protein
MAAPPATDFSFFTLQSHSIKSDIVIVIIIISLLIAAALFQIYMSDSYGRLGLPKDKKGVFFTLINDLPGVSVFIHQSRLKNNPIPLLEPAGIPKDYYFLTNYDWSGKLYRGSLPPELFAKAYARGYDIKKYTPRQLADIFKDTYELRKTFHSSPHQTEFGPDYFERKTQFALDQLQSELFQS